MFPPNHLQSFVFPASRPELRFGCGLASELGGIASGRGASKAIIVTDPGVAGLAEPLVASLGAAGIAHLIYDKVRPDSGSDLVMEGAALAKSGGADLVVGLGGGSALDSAKAIAVMMANEGSILDYVGLDRVPNPSAPCICLPTTSGTGSEVSIWSVLTDDSSGTKVSVGGYNAMAEVALCDPDLTASLPPQITAATGMDAIGHACECFVNQACQPMSGALALQSIGLIGASLRTAVSDGDNRQARYDMMMGSVLAGMAMNPTRLGLAHALAMPLGSGTLKIPHGTIIAITLPRVMAFNAEAAPERYAAITRALRADTRGMSLPEAAALSADLIADLARDVGIPAGLSEFGMREDLVDGIVEDAMKSGNVAVNPRATDADQLAGILRASI